MWYRKPITSLCLVGTSAFVGGPANAADDATTICKAAVSAYEDGIASGDPVKLASTYAQDGELVSPFGVVSGHDALVKTFASFLKPGDKELETITSSRVVGDVALCSGDWTYTPASGGPMSKGYWTKVVGKVGNDWKIYALVYNVEPSK
jgi:ketosteroid isomerase-like protein